MYEDIVKEMKEKMAPVVEMAEINKKTAEELMSLQSDYFSDMFTSSMAQFKALTEVKDPKDILDLQLKFFKEAESKMTSVAEKELAAMTSAKDEYTAIVEKNFSDFSDMPYFKEMGKFDFSSFDLSKFMPAMATPAAKTAAKTTTTTRKAATSSTTAAA